MKNKINKFNPGDKVLYRLDDDGDSVRMSNGIFVGYKPKRFLKKQRCIVRTAYSSIIDDYYDILEEYIFLMVENERIDLKEEDK